MSITSAASAAVVAQQREEASKKAGPVTTPAAEDRAGAIERITRYIPSEIIGIYVALLGLWSPDDRSAKWTVFFIGLLLTPFFVIYSYVTKRAERRAKGLHGTKPLILLSVFAVVGFTAWSAALPDTPWEQVFGDDTTRLGGGAVILLAAVLPPLAQMLRLEPRS